MTYIVVHNVLLVAEYDRLLRVIGRTWVDWWTITGEVRYPLASDADPEVARAVLALAGFQSTIETEK